MVTILANIETTISEFIENFDFYLFVFSDGCKEYKFIFSPSEKSCPGFIVFDVNIDLPAGVYILEIYGQDNNSNLNTNNAVFLFSDTAKIINPEGYCFGMPYLLDPFGYPILDTNNINILYQ